MVAAVRADKDRVLLSRSTVTNPPEIPLKNDPEVGVWSRISQRTFGLPPSAAKLRTVVAGFQPQQCQEIADLFDDGVGLDHSRDSRVTTPNRVHARGSRACDVHFRVISDKDRSGGIGMKSLERALEDPWIGLADALRRRYHDGVKCRGERQTFHFSTLHGNRAIGDQPQLEPRCSQHGKRVVGIREEHAGARKSGAVIAQQSLGQVRRKPELRHRAAEETVPRSVPVTVELDNRLNVLPPVYGAKGMKEPFPLTSHKLLEASAAIEEGPVEIEDYRLNIRRHLHCW